LKSKLTEDVIHVLTTLREGLRFLVDCFLYFLTPWTARPEEECIICLWEVNVNETYELVLYTPTSCFRTKIIVRPNVGVWNDHFWFIGSDGLEKGFLKSFYDAPKWGWYLKEIQ
jgi:hypothetical protein